MQQFMTKTVREIALEMPLTTRVFEEFKIDYCCRGNTMFDEACRNAGTDPAVVIDRLGDVVAEGSEPDAFATATLTSLIVHIRDTHHAYTRDETAQLKPLMEKVVMRHGDHYPYLCELRVLFVSLVGELGPHMSKEEMVLFPYIEQMEAMPADTLSAETPPFGTVQNPIRMMRVEHDDAGQILRQMRLVTDNYLLPEGACPSFTALFHRLEALERDLHRHIHLENNLLFPRAIELEQRIFPMLVN